MKQSEKDARNFLAKWFGCEDEVHFGDNDTEIASYLYDDISNGEIDEIINIMRKFAKEQIKKIKETEG